MPSFGTVALPDINPLFDLASVDKNINTINSGRLTNQLASNTLDSNTQIAANTAESGSLATQYARQRNPLEISLLRQQTGAEPSPVLDRLQQLYTGVGAAPATPAAPIGNFQQDLGAAEAPNPGVVNPGGYSGQFQFGAARLADPGIGVYTPAPGENVNANTWQGTFDIPGFPGVKTHAQFLANPDAQRAVFAAHVADIDNAIAQTPGTDRLNQNGLRAVAHLGGVAGMERFVATGGAYDPADKNGTHLSDYYSKFSQGGPRALQMAFGHPDGPPGQPAQPGVALAPNAPAAPAPTLTPVQTATRAPLPGDTASDGTSGAAPGFGPDGRPLATPPAAPAGQGVAEVMARLRNAPQVQNQNPLLDVAAPGGSAPAAPQNALAPVPVQQPVAAPTAPAPSQPSAPPTVQPPTGMNSPQVQQAQDLMRRATQIEIAAAATPNDPRVKASAAAMASDLRARAAVIMNTDSVVVQNDGTQLHPITGKVDNAAMPVHNPSRVTKVDGPGGTILTQPGAADRIIPYSGRPEQTDAYKGDLVKADALTNAAQSAQASMPRLNEMAALAGELSTGPTAETRAKGAALLEQLGASPEAIKNWTGMPSGSAAQEFIKLSIATAGSAAKADVGSNNGIQSTQLYQAANPNLNLLPDANKRITNMMRVSAQSIQDYAQAALQHFGTNEATFLKGGNYAPLTTFNREWQSQANPQVYAAATGILNGDSFDKWSAKISPAEGARAAQIAARVDPTVQVPGKGGGMIPVKDILSHPSITKPAN